MMRNLINNPSNEKREFKSSKRTKTIIIALALGLATQMLSGCRAAFSDDTITILIVHDDKNDEFENAIPIFDEEGKQVDLSTDGTIVFYDGNYRKKKDEKVEVFALNTVGETIKGYVFSDYLEKIDVLDAETLETYNCIYQICNDGNDVNFRSSPEIVNENIKSEIEDETYFLGDPQLLVCNKDASVWIKCLIVSDKGFEEGYINSKYAEREDNIRVVVNNHNKTLKDKRIMEVDTNGTSLRLRTEDRDTSNDNNILTEIPDGSIVYVVDDEEVEENGITWIKVEYYELDNGYITGWVSRDYLTNVKTLKKYVKEGVTLNLRSKPNIESTILAKIQEGTVLQIPEVIFENAEKNGDYYWTEIVLEDGTRGYVATDYLIDYISKEDYEAEMAKRKELIEEIRKRTEINSNGNVTGIDVAFITGKDLGIILDDEYAIGDTVFNRDGVEYYSADLGKKINYAFIEVGAMSQNSSKIFDRPNCFDCMKECEKRKIPFGVYYYSTAISIEEADKEIAYILDIYDEIKSMELEYDLLPFVLDREAGFSSVEDRKLYPGIDTSEITAYLIDKLGEKLPYRVVLYGGGRDLGGKEGQTIFDIDTVNSLLNGKPLYVYPALHRTKDGSSIADPSQKERIENTKSKKVIEQCLLDVGLTNKGLYANLNEIKENIYFEEILTGEIGKRIKEPTKLKDNKGDNERKEENDNRKDNDNDNGNKNEKHRYSFWEIF